MAKGELFLARSSIENLNMNLKKNELEPSLSQDLWDCWRKIISDNNTFITDILEMLRQKTMKALIY